MHTSLSLLWFSVLFVIDLAWGGSDSFSVLGTYGAGFITPSWLNENSTQSFLCRSRGVPEASWSPHPRGLGLQLTAAFITDQPLRDSKWRRGEKGEACTHAFCIRLRRCPLRSPKDELSPLCLQWPQAPLFVGVSVHGHCIYDQVTGCVGVWGCGGVWACVCVSTYKGQSISMAHLQWNLIWLIGSMMGRRY